MLVPLTSACAAVGGAWAARDLASSRAAGVPAMRVVFVTDDPARDTPTVLDRYVRAFDRHCVALTGASASIRALARRLGVAYERVALPGGDYTIDHTAVAFLLDSKARVAADFTLPLQAGQFASDLRRAAPSLAVHG